MFHKTGGNMLGAASVKQEHTLGEYIARKTAFDKPKLTFEEWLSHRFPTGFENFDGNLTENDLQLCWKAAQENM